MFWSLHNHVPQRFEIGSGGSEIFGDNALKTYFLFGASTDAFFTEDTKLSTNGKFARISPRYITESVGGEGLLFMVVVRSHRWQVAVLAQKRIINLMYHPKLSNKSDQ